MYNYYPYGYPIVPNQSIKTKQHHLDYRSQQLNIPYLPILGMQSMNQLVSDLSKAIVDEATAADFYSRLLKQAPNELHREFIKHAYEDELKHFQAFSKLYKHFTGKTPQYEIKPVQYPNYKTGILMALKDELEAAEFYRNMKLSSSDQLVRDTFFFAMGDEIEHSTRFSVLYNTL